jgi:hypothetical protein
VAAGSRRIKRRLAPSALQITASTRWRFQIFAIVQIAASFILLAGAVMLVKTLLNLQATRPGFQTSNVLAIDLPVVWFGRNRDMRSARGEFMQ